MNENAQNVDNPRSGVATGDAPRAEADQDKQEKPAGQYGIRCPECGWELRLSYGRGSV